MELLAEEAQVEAQFSLFGDSANIDARQVHGLRGTYHMLENRLDAPDGTPSEVCRMESRFVCLETVLVSVQDRFMVYA